MTIHKYRVKEGFKYGVNPEYGPGDIVELDDTIAQFEMDKLELAEIVHNVPDTEDTTSEEGKEETVKPPSRSSTRKSKSTTGN
jgi:hypothetical protein